MKIILPVICMLITLLSFKTDIGNLPGENGRLTVTATCRDDYRLTEQADAGCEIYAINESDVMSTQYADLKYVVELFQGFKYDYLLSIYNSVDPARNNNLRDNFDTLSDVTFKFISGFKKLPAIARVATDGAGICTLNLRPGRYYLLVISGSVKSNNKAESKGNIGYKIVDIKTAQETIQHVCFHKYDMTGIMTARNLSGC